MTDFAGIMPNSERNIAAGYRKTRESSVLAECQHWHVEIKTFCQIRKRQTTTSTCVRFPRLAQPGCIHRHETAFVMNLVAGHQSNDFLKFCH